MISCHPIRFLVWISALFLAFHERDSFVSAQCLLCGEDGTLSNPDGFIDTNFVQATCLTVQNNPNLLPAGFCEILQTSSAIAGICGCTNPTQSCPICGADGTITNPGGQITFGGIFGTCELINNNQRVIRGDEACRTVQRSSLIAGACGCVDPIQFCPVCGGGVLTNPNGIISTNDVEGTCEVINNNQRTIPVCAEVQNNATIAGNCTCANDPVQTCPVCGTGTITKPDGLIITKEVFATCAIVNDNQRTIPAAFCPTLQFSSIIADTCGCIEVPTSCPLCGENGILTKPDADLSEGGFQGTCGVLNDNPRLLPPFSCEVFQGLAQANDRCGCVPGTPTPPPILAPTTAPVVVEPTSGVGSFFGRIIESIRNFFGSS